MDSSFSSSVSGIKAAITRQDITAHDVANIDTPGFKEQIPHQVETKPDGTKISHISRRPNTQKDLSNTSLTEETKEQIQNKRALGANAKVLKVKNDMLGEVIDLVG